MFLTQTGTVMGAAEMLYPDSWTSQPFRFVSLDECDRCRLRAAIEMWLAQSASPGSNPKASGQGDHWNPYTR
jgi:hypothetical protein